MARKRTPPRDRDATRSAGVKPVFSSPFKELKKLLKDRTDAGVRPAPGKPEPVPAQADSQDDDSLLRQALHGVRRLNDSRPARLPVQPPVSHTVVSEDAEVLAELSDLVSGQGPFDITETEEYTEGTRVGLDPRLVMRLRRGEFSVQAHIDLHGMIQVAAKGALATFILESVRKGWRCVLVVHGRGRGSPGGQPILKHATAQWLSRGSLSGYILAFTTARPADGGAGALYVMLKRDRRRAKFDVLNGAKRRG